MRQALLQRPISVTIVDDEPLVTETITQYLQLPGFEIQAYNASRESLSAFKQQPTDIMIVDWKMPNMDGLTLLKEVKEASPTTEVIMITGYGSKELAIHAIRAEVHDFLEKPVTRPELIRSIERTRCYQAFLRQQVHQAESLSITSPDGTEWGIFVGKSEAIQDIIRRIHRLQEDGTTAVLIAGESGTGKELIARAIHALSPRASEPFVPVNCAAIPAELAESMLFGHLRGAFTGATNNQEGYFESADGGTLFLDEIGEMPLEIQAKLLRVLEDGIVTPVGTTDSRQMDVRILAATNSDLRTKVDSGAFRGDLYYRLAEFEVILPPLRARKADIPVLAHHFLKALATEMGMEHPMLSPAAVAALEMYPFPGNVRELKNMIRRVLIESAGLVIQPADLYRACSLTGVTHASEIQMGEGYRSQSRIDEMLAEQERIQRALAENRGNIAKTARHLGLTRHALYRRLEKYGLR